MERAQNQPGPGIHPRIHRDGEKTRVTGQRHGKRGRAHAHDLEVVAVDEDVFEEAERLPLGHVVARLEHAPEGGEDLSSRLMRAIDRLKWAGGRDGEGGRPVSRMGT